MNLPEYLGKLHLARAGLRIPRGGVAVSPEEAQERAAAVAGPIVLKAQVPAGKRGKSGAIRVASSPEEAAAVAAELLGSSVADFPVERILVEEQVAIEQELYAAVVNDPSSKGPLVLFSTEGGMDIEEVSAATPEKVMRRPLDVRSGLAEDEARRVVDGAALEDGLKPEIATVLLALYGLYRELDADLIEVNPLVIERDGGVRALDCKLSLDDGARPRHSELFEEAEAVLPETGTELERRGRRLGFLFIELDGDVGVLANGAGLTMTTMDAVNHYGGRPANFLEIGGDAYTKATPALELVLSNPKVKSLLVNFCGAFARTDVMTEGVVNAIEELRPELPISFSIHGTGEEEAVALVRRRLGLEPFDLMDDAVKAAIAGAAEAGRTTARSPS